MKTCLLGRALTINPSPRGRGKFFFLVVGVLVVAKLSMASGTAKEALVESAHYFDKGQYKKAIDLLRDINIRSDFDSSDDMKMAFKIRAISFEQTNEPKLAAETIRELLFLDPSYQFSPFDTPPSVVALAEKERANIDQKSRRLASIKTEAQGLRQGDKAPSNTAKALPHLLYKRDSAPFITTLFPLGLNHFYLGLPIKGGIYLSLQALSLGTNIAAFWWKSSYLHGFGSNYLKDPANKGRFETAQTIQYIALGAMIIGYGASIIDALIEWKRMPLREPSLYKTSL